MLRAVKSDIAKALVTIPWRRPVRLYLLAAGLRLALKIISLYRPTIQCVLKQSKPISYQLVGPINFIDWLSG